MAPSYTGHADPAALLMRVAFPRLQVLLTLFQRALLLAMPTSVKHATQTCYLLSQLRTPRTFFLCWFNDPDLLGLYKVTLPFAVN